MWWLFPPGVMDSRGETVFDVRDLPGEGGGMKVLQEVRRGMDAGADG